MNIIFCPLTSRIIRLLRSMDSLKTHSLLQRCLCPTRKEMNWNDFNYHKKGLGFSLLYTPTPNRSTHRPSLRKVQGHRHLTATRNNCPDSEELGGQTNHSRRRLLTERFRAFSKEERTGEVAYVTQFSCSVSAHGRQEWKGVVIIVYLCYAGHNAKCSSWRTSKAEKAPDKPRKAILH